MRPETGVMLQLSGNPVHSHAGGCCAARSSVLSPTLSCFPSGPAAWQGRLGYAGRSPNKQQNEGQSGALGLVHTWCEWAASSASFGRCTYGETCAIPALGSFPLVLPTGCTRPRTQGGSPGRCTGCQQGLFRSAEGAQPGRLREWRQPASPLLQAGRVQERPSTRRKAAKEGNAARRRAEGRVRPWGVASARNVSSCAAGGVRHATQGGWRWQLHATTGSDYRRSR